MATAPFGQIAISNQPSFHIPYLFPTAITLTTLPFSSRRSVRKLFTQVGKPILEMKTMVVSLLGTSGQLSDFIQPVQENQAMTSNPSL